VGLIVSESKRKQRYWLTFLLEDLDVGNTFKPGLLHFTLVTWFMTNMPEQEIIDSFNSTFANTKSLKVKVGKSVNFGPKKDVPAALVDAIPELLKLHYKALQWMKKIEARWVVKNPYAGEEFRPHIRLQPDARISEGKILPLNSLSLIKAKRQEDNVRTVAAKVPLNE
jgi:2'-5' RNA ligase